ncbi:MAG: HAD hydrolase-like protein [Thermodesulfobacteriota bacterium]
MKIENILFDLDGTLTDPRVGITRSIQYALEKLGRTVPPADDLLWCIGPPLQESLGKLLPADPDRAKAALSFYRERFNAVGKFENEVYPGVMEVLDVLSAQGLNLFVATSKPAVYAREIIAHFDLLAFFKKVYGSELNGDLTDKGALISHILLSEMLAAPRTVMIGDRSYDIRGAAKNNVRSLGVTYGYGTKNELLEAGADYIAGSPHEILHALKGLL